MGVSSLENDCLQVTSDTISRLITDSLIELSRSDRKLGRDWTARSRADSSRAYASARNARTVELIGRGLSADRTRTVQLERSCCCSLMKDVPA